MATPGQEGKVEGATGVHGRLNKCCCYPRLAITLLLLKEKGAVSLMIG
jgi:hypothetical protein